MGWGRAGPRGPFPQVDRVPPAGIEPATSRFRKPRVNITGWDWWIVAGGALQVIGVAALVIDIVATFRRLERYRTRGRTVYAGSALEIDVAFPIGAVVGGGELRSMSVWIGLKRDSPSSEMTSEARRLDSRTGRVRPRLPQRSWSERAASSGSRHSSKRSSATRVGTRADASRASLRSPWAWSSRPSGASPDATLAATPGSKRQYGAGRAGTVDGH